jgi:hypothetical protein
MNKKDINSLIRKNLKKTAYVYTQEEEEKAIVKRKIIT